MKLLDSKSLSLVVTIASAFALSSCAMDKHNTSLKPQKVIEAVNAKYPGEAINLMHIGAPESCIGSYLEAKEVEKGVDAGKVTAITSALDINTATVVVTGIDDDLNAATLSRVLTTGKDKISGAKVVYVGGKDSHAELSKQASDAGVTLEFMDVPS